ncbi:hypothetical protein PoB_002769000 [Plakobranchus ocellatus]|uniref:Uncharacterized protein n=1 Tax=Plakobranchus ocellatus TaxID=259542 RepID=A0AAV4A2N1_9GAST|nr:hypothetical protein PoB_002769000 [Plakobranchus ocellatus]
MEGHGGFNAIEDEFSTMIGGFSINNTDYGQVLNTTSNDDMMNSIINAERDMMGLAVNGVAETETNKASKEDNSRSDLIRFLNSIGIPELEGNGCCRRRQNENCRSTRQRLACFSSIFNGRAEKCCPIFPVYPWLYVADCACRCRSVFTSRTFYAICSRNIIFFRIRRFTRRLPTICSCRGSRNG